MKRVYLEITDACNLRCPFCTYEKKDHFMSLEQIDDYTSQIKPFCDYLYLHILGEPLLHPDFYQCGISLQNLKQLMRLNNIKTNSPLRKNGQKM